MSASGWTGQRGISPGRSATASRLSGVRRFYDSPALPGCVTQGETKEEALEMIKDAIAGYLESLKKHGDPLPPGAADAEFVP